MANKPKSKKATAPGPTPNAATNDPPTSVPTDMHGSNNNLQPDPVVAKDVAETSSSVIPAAEANMVDDSRIALTAEDGANKVSISSNTGENVPTSTKGSSEKANNSDNVDATILPTSKSDVTPTSANQINSNEPANDEAAAPASSIVVPTVAASNADGEEASATADAADDDNRTNPSELSADKSDLAGPAILPADDVAEESENSVSGATSNPEGTTAVEVSTIADDETSYTRSVPTVAEVAVVVEDYDGEQQEGYADVGVDDVVRKASGEEDVATEFTDQTQGPTNEEEEYFEEDMLEEEDLCEEDVDLQLDKSQSNMSLLGDLDLDKTTNLGSVDAIVAQSDSDDNLIEDEEEEEMSSQSDFHINFDDLNQSEEEEMEESESYDSMSMKDGFYFYSGKLDTKVEPISESNDEFSSLEESKSPTDSYFENTRFQMEQDYINAKKKFETAKHKNKVLQNALVYMINGHEKKDANDYNVEESYEDQIAYLKIFHECYNLKVEHEQLIENKKSEVAYLLEQAEEKKQMVSVELSRIISEKKKLVLGANINKSNNRLDTVSKLAEDERKLMDKLRGIDFDCSMIKHDLTSAAETNRQKEKLGSGYSVIDGKQLKLEQVALLADAEQKLKLNNQVLREMKSIGRKLIHVKEKLSHLTNKHKIQLKVNAKKKKVPTATLR